MVNPPSAMAEGRELTNWLMGYREYSKESEAPDSFHLWIGLSVIASVVRRNVKLDMGLFPVFPNLYVVLVSPQGKIGKSTNIRLGKELLNRLEDIYMGPDSCTREELIQSMVGAEKAHGSAVTIHSSEFSSLIDPSGIMMVQFLTDIYDCANVWRYDTKASGKYTIHLPVLNILAGTTPEWISDGLPEAAIRGGFTGRTIFVYEEKTRFSNPFPEPPKQDLIEKLVADLDSMADIRGTFELEDSARELYKQKYEEWQEHDSADHRIAGYYNRKRIHVLKVAMLLSIAESNKLQIMERDLQTAIKILEITERNMARTFSAIGKYEHALTLERIMAQIYRNGGSSMSEIVRHHFQDGSAEEISRIVQTLAAMDMITYNKEEQRYKATAIGRASLLRWQAAAGGGEVDLA